MTRTLEAAISEAQWKVRKRRREQLIIRYRKENGDSRYLSSPTLTGMINRTRVGESPLCILRVLLDGSVFSTAKEFDNYVTTRSLSLAEIRNGTGFERNARFTQIH